MTPQMLHDAMQLLSWIGAAALLLTIAYLVHRKGLDIVTQRAVTEWKNLAEAYEGQVAHLQGELDALHKANDALATQNQQLKDQNSGLVSLNLTLQTLNVQHLATIQSLERRLESLESKGS